MSYHIDLQHASDETIPFDDNTLISWATLPLKEHQKSGELTLRIVNQEEIKQLNFTYRQNNKATNVLAFPSNVSNLIPLDHPFLGDIIICPSVLQTESLELGKSEKAHWAHIIIHGVLHLLGYDHIEEGEAKVMEALEIKLLAQLGFPDPYQTEGTNIE